MVEYGAMDDIFAALSDPTRRAILTQLLEGPARVSEIARPYSMSLNAVSKHVRALEKAKLVKRDIRGREHWIRFNKGPMQDARNWVDAMLSYWAQRRDSDETAFPANQENADRNG